MIEGFKPSLTVPSFVSRHFAGAYRNLVIFNGPLPLEVTEYFHNHVSFLGCIFSSISPVYMLSLLSFQKYSYIYFKITL